LWSASVYSLLTNEEKSFLPLKTRSDVENVKHDLCDSGNCHRLSQFDMCIV
jgi:hypothetical protein